MESHPIEASALPLPQTVVSPALQCSSPGALCSKPRDRMKTPAFLSNLGKPTLRGIRKCPQCGIYNGTRGLSCKNKACGAIFRDSASAGARRSAKKGGGGGSEVVRIVTDGGGGGPFMDGGSGGPSSSSSCSSAPGAPQVFSLRQRGRGPEQRGFVELTLTDTAIATTDGTLLTRLSLGRCFLPACRRQQQQQQQQQQHGQRGVASSSSPPSSSSSSPPQASDSPCGHVRQAMECPPSQVATPLLLKSSVLDGLPVSAQTRQELWRLANDTPGPLVQRVSRNSLVVKCHTSDSQALGLLHCIVGGAGVKGESGGVVFRCACQQGAGGGVGARGPAGVLRPSSLGSLSSTDDKETELADVLPLSPTPDGATQCLHFYACVCAFASDDKLAVEFAHFLSYSSNGLQVSLGSTALCASDAQPISEPITPHRTKRLKAEEPITVAGPALAIREASAPAPGPRKPSSRRQALSIGHKTAGNNQPVDEADVSLPFQQWLASVNEKIHQSMHYQFDGKPEPLVFHIPQSFFNALQQRLSLGSKKRRLPNSTTTFVRHDALPLGSFSKYTWHITNIMHVKQIFDTPELPLKLTQSFVRNSDGSYSPFTCPEVPAEPLTEAFGRTDRPQAIRPFELNTFLKVGISSPGQKEPTPFVIEWIPDILPRSKVGELRLRFEYGHQPTSPTEH